jgi:glycosyltransferase XagB
MRAGLEPRDDSARASDGVAPECWGAGLPPTPAQWFFSIAILVTSASLPLLYGEQGWEWLFVTAASFFLLAAAWRVALMALAQRPPPAAAVPLERLPSYTVIAPAYREAGMLPQLVESLAALDYPPEQLQVILALEAHDRETIAAAARLDLPPGFEVMIAPPGAPKTKPRACNHALARTRGELLVIYDAEDRPDRAQLKEAAAAFAAGPPELACVQAPLRIANSGGFLPAQFANEYAAQFELQQPALARLGLPFPLGGTSNHFRVEVLRRLGGWDPWNVTEDADLGFRLARAGLQTGVIAAPTWEAAPDNLRDWLLQRSRWLKGYMQTIGVQTRSGVPPLRIAFALFATIGFALLSAAVHAFFLGWLLLLAAFSFVTGQSLEVPPLYLTALGVGGLTAIASKLVGAGRAGVPVRLRDGCAALLYWPLLSLAFWHALVQLFLTPHHWHKTPHKPWRPRAP